MKTKTGSIVVLNETIDIFDEKSWDFMGVVANQDINYEYFNEVIDLGFIKKEKRINKIARFLVLIFCISIVFTVGIFAIYNNINTVGKDISAYKSLETDSNTTGLEPLQRVEDGVEAPSQDLILCSTTLTNYFSCLNNKSDYSYLYDLCSVTSTFGDTYFITTSKIRTLWDTNDCYARVFKELGGISKFIGVNELILKDDIYYAYVTLRVPTSSDMMGYVHTNTYNITKYFTKNKIKEQNIVKFLLDNMQTNPLPCSEQEFQIRLKNDNGVFKILDDSFITSNCIDAYNDAVTQITYILSGKK